MAEEIQKHQLLVKLLKMTTSDTDAEALVAIRKANDLLRSAGWDWDRLMANKITVVGDPFAGLGDPSPKYRPAVKDDWNFDDGQQTQAPAPPPRPTPPPPQNKRLPINSTFSNKFEGACYCCGILVAKQGGFIFHPSDYHSRATKDWRVACTSCNSDPRTIIAASPAARQGRGARKVTADDIL